MPVCDMDVRPGGKYRWRWRSDEDGTEFGFFGEFKEVDRPALLSHDQYYDPGNADFAMPLDNPCKIRNSFIETDGDHHAHRRDGFRLKRSARRRRLHRHDRRHGDKL